MRPGLARPDARGQAVVEFSLVIVVALVVLMAVLDVGRAVYGLGAVSNAARVGGRTAIVNQNGDDIRQKAASLSVGLGVDASPVACSAGTSTNPPTPTGPSGTCVEYRTTDLSGTCATIDLGCVAVVTTKWTYTPLTPLIGTVVGPIALTSTTRVPVESVCSGVGCPVP